MQTKSVRVEEGTSLTTELTRRISKRLWIANHASVKYHLAGHGAASPKGEALYHISVSEHKLALGRHLSQVRRG